MAVQAIVGLRTSHVTFIHTFCYILLFIIIHFIYIAQYYNDSKLMTYNDAVFTAIATLLVKFENRKMLLNFHVKRYNNYCN